MNEKRKKLNCYEAKARRVADDLEAVAKVLGPYRRSYISQEHEDRRKVWAGKLAMGPEQQDVQWPDWESLSPDVP